MIMVPSPGYAAIAGLGHPGGIWDLTTPAQAAGGGEPVAGTPTEGQPLAFRVSPGPLSGGFWTHLTILSRCNLGQSWPRRAFLAREHGRRLSCLSQSGPCLVEVGQTRGFSHRTWFALAAVVTLL